MSSRVIYAALLMFELVISASAGDCSSYAEESICISGQECVWTSYCRGSLCVVGDASEAECTRISGCVWITGKSSCDLAADPDRTAFVPPGIEIPIVTSTTVVADAPMTTTTSFEETVTESTADPTTTNEPTTAGDGMVLSTTDPITFAKSTSAAATTVITATTDAGAASIATSPSPSSATKAATATSEIQANISTASSDGTLSSSISMSNSTTMKHTSAITASSHSEPNSSTNPAHDQACSTYENAEDETTCVGCDYGKGDSSMNDCTLDSTCPCRLTCCTALGRSPTVAASTTDHATTTPEPPTTTREPSTTADAAVPTTTPESQTTTPEPSTTVGSISTTAGTAIWATCANEVGESDDGQVSYIGYISDNACNSIDYSDGETGPDGVNILNEPWKHSVWCLLLGKCQRSGFSILAPNNQPSVRSPYAFKVQYTLDDDGNSRVLSMLNGLSAAQRSKSNVTGIRGLQVRITWRGSLEDTIAMNASVVLCRDVNASSTSTSIATTVVTVVTTTARPVVSDCVGVIDELSCTNAPGCLWTNRYCRDLRCVASDYDEARCKVTGCVWSETMALCDGAAVNSATTTLAITTTDEPTTIWVTEEPVVTSRTTATPTTTVVATMTSTLVPEVRVNVAGTLFCDRKSCTLSLNTIAELVATAVYATTTAQHPQALWADVTCMASTMTDTHAEIKESYSVLGPRLPLRRAARDASGEDNESVAAPSLTSTAEPTTSDGSSDPFIPYVAISSSRQVDVAVIITIIFPTTSEAHVSRDWYQEPARITDFAYILLEIGGGSRVAAVPVERVSFESSLIASTPGTPAPPPAKKSSDAAIAAVVAAVVVIVLAMVVYNANKKGMFVTWRGKLILTRRGSTNIEGFGVGRDNDFDDFDEDARDTAAQLAGPKLRPTSSAWEDHDAVVADDRKPSGSMPELIQTFNGETSSDAVASALARTTHASSSRRSHRRAPKDRLQSDADNDGIEILSAVRTPRVRKETQTDNSPDGLSASRRQKTKRSHGSTRRRDLHVNENRRADGSSTNVYTSPTEIQSAPGATGNDDGLRVYEKQLAMGLSSPKNRTRIPQSKAGNALPARESGPGASAQKSNYLEVERSDRRPHLHESGGPKPGSGLTRTELRSKLEAGEITKAEYKALRKANPSTSLKSTIVSGPDDIRVAPSDAQRPMAREVELLPGVVQARAPDASRRPKAGLRSEAPFGGNQAELDQIKLLRSKLAQGKITRQEYEHFKAVHKKASSV